jgi:hypothetical protein
MAKKSFKRLAADEIKTKKTGVDYFFVSHRNSSDAEIKF